MKSKNTELSSPRLKKLEKELAKIQKAGKYLDAEKRKLIRQREIVNGKIRKEKEVLGLKKKIAKLKA